MSVGVSLDQQWARIRGRLKDEVGEIAYRSWLQPLSVASMTGGEVCIVVPTRFMRDWVLTHYADRIRALWSGENPDVHSIDVVVASTNAPAVLTADNDDRDDPPPNRGMDRSQDRGQDRGESRSPFSTSPERRLSSASDSGSAAAGHVAAAASSPYGGAAAAVYTSSSYGGASDESPNGVPAILEDRSDLSAALDPRFTFENFVVGKPNELAHAAARRVADATTVTFNPLFLYGGVGIGKTHLLHAIGHAARARQPDLRVRYVPAETFIEDTIRAMRSMEPSARSVVRDLYRDGVDMLLIDDIQFLQGKEKTQEEFFHTFNALHQAGKQVVLTCDRFPSELQQFHDRLRSRFDWGLVAEIAPPDRDLRCAILRQKVQEAGLTVPDDVLTYLAEHLRNNVRELEGALNKLSAHQMLLSRAAGTQRPIDLALARSVLGPLIELPSRQLTAETIQRATAQHFNLKVTDLKGARRHRNVVVPRMIATHLIRKHTPLSYPDIGRVFGGRDHSTAIHACQKVEWMLQTDPAIQAAVQAIETMLGK